MEISKMNSKENLKSLWKEYNDDYQEHVITNSTIDSTTELIEESNKKVVYMNDLEKRKQVYGICGECNEPGTGIKWCQPCNAKRFKDNFKNWTSGNKDIDEFIQQSQLNAVHYKKYIEWIPFENFKDITYITKGGFGKIYSAKWPEGYIDSWDIENQKWKKYGKNIKFALKSLDNSSCLSTEFLNEIKSHLQIYLYDVIQCYGITQDPNTKDYMMVLKYCDDGNLRNYYLNNESNYYSKIYEFRQIARGLLDIHNAGKIHKDFHSGNILCHEYPYISDLGMCQPANSEKQSAKQEGIYGVLPYMAPEVLRGYQYTKASDIYSFGIMMNEYISEETPYNNIPHDYALSIKICKGLRPNIFKYTPKLLADLINKCWDAKAENRPTAKELYQKLNERYNDMNKDSESQVDEYDDKIKLNRTSEKRSSSIQTHPQAIYTSRLLNFKNLPEPVNSVTEGFDCQLDESDLNEMNQDDENNIE
ncbi:kinase-like domain-containing protein [Rhizophagus irregularis DAOM 181602=DAOM 197198]|uniref:Kinase-like domain-containing protein n=1 Tax=Rhizophagus irregularis (strain DAOM 181602 / DAOM 197198 / MUCL 43194) TaxID=747089 RepID=A0A2P4QS93_RHIID|nr:kinase-like domain-containing protein [Rhizophagus irregularis DAOM 181602=DAOM 197198]POG80511.1 kinase-like domain-containing protein [Rhizophagus irregularis DAOM 181602=DAOM 197198]|eukprot:XP_025187377.1 kinase-like domain-containing protein [Rhizophagus irregularis DAOM 181602=DAOM 197198]